MLIIVLIIHWVATAWRERWNAFVAKAFVQHKIVTISSKNFTYLSVSLWNRLLWFSKPHKSSKFGHCVQSFRATLLSPIYEYNPCSIPLVYSLIAKHISLLSQSFFRSNKKLCTLFMGKLKIRFGRKPFCMESAVDVEELWMAWLLRNSFQL